MSANAALPADPLVAFVLACGKGGLARVEIAAELAVTVAALEGLAAKHPVLAEALALADEAAEAAWLALPWRVLKAGKSLNAAAWRAAMEWRFGAGASAPPGTAAGAGEAPRKRRMIIDLPNTLRARKPGRPEPPEWDADWEDQVQHWINQRNTAEAELREAREELRELGWQDLRGQTYDKLEDGWDLEEEGDGDDGDDERDDGDSADGDGGYDDGLRDDGHPDDA